MGRKRGQGEVQRRNGWKKRTKFQSREKSQEKSCEYQKSHRNNKYND